MLKKLIIISLSCLILGGCASEEPVVEEPTYADQDFISDMSKGLQTRWKLNAEDEAKEGYDEILVNSEEYQEMMNNYIQAELDYVEKYQNEKFEDSNLQEIAVKYVNLLKQHKDACQYMTVDYDKYLEVFQPVYNERSKIISQLVNDYGMTVDEEYQQTLNDFLTNSQLVVEQENEEAAIQQMLDGIQFDEVDDNGGYKTYQAVVENTTGIDFNTLNITINLLNSDGVIVETAYDNVSAFAQGAKVQFEFMTDKEFTSTQVSVDWWE